MNNRVLVLGSFDLLHYGHLRFLNHAAKLGDVYVGLGTTEYQEGYKRKPTLSYEERRRALAELPMVAAVVERDQVSIGPLLRKIEPQYLMAGSDWIDRPFLELSGITVHTLEQMRIALVYAPRDHEFSSTTIMRRLGHEA